MKALVAGWFSFVDGHATAGDLLTRDVVCDWLDQMGWKYDIAMAAPFHGGVDWRSVDPNAYSHVLFVCGPFQRLGHETEFLDRFAECHLVGLNLSMLEPKTTWNPFDLLLERDSSDCVRPDLAFLSSTQKVPVVGLCLVEPYPEALAREVHEALERLVKSREMAVIQINTRLDADSNNALRTPAEVESLIGRTDLLLTTRLHGLVLALKNGIPAIAIDPEPGGAKIFRQAELLGWPLRFVADTLDDQTLHEALSHGLTDAAKGKARECRERARKLLQETSAAFKEEMCGGGSMQERYQSRLAVTNNSGDPGGTTRVSATSFRRKLSDGWLKVRKRLYRPNT